ncbi:hypothetical protein M076_1082 [Bacteroides fragilis str. 2-F-2 |uniref:Uncharacterized protein n=1 Tax=Bacteroides fragilis str. 2-F-2 \|nr:hypothetical protein M077_1153 [Bacteroides fragilis str. 2-F-2 \
MFICCNGKILLFTEINNSKRGYPTFWTAPFYLEYHLNRNKDFKVKCIMEWKSGDGFSTL